MLRKTKKVISLLCALIFILPTLSYSMDKEEFLKFLIESSYPESSTKNDNLKEEKDKEDKSANKEEDYIKFKPSKNKYYNSKGYVQPFDDSPLINEPIGETVYLNLINKAKDYIYINTPYLIIDNEMATALKIAAKSGVDIKIVTPYIPDKKFVHAVTKSYYESFIKDGIEIYEFTPGFMHAKTFVVDDEYGVVGSINLDFRSLYLHYECGVWLYKTDSIKSMKDDYLETLKRCHKVTMEECKNTSSIRKVLRLIIRMFAPLL